MSPTLTSHGGGFGASPQQVFFCILNFKNFLKIFLKIFKYRICSNKYPLLNNCAPLS
uniref:Uncharacterized protein n=1 Tax=Meloidogyne enterolobii TaxID=390850 RepID=A0A6V7VAL6_MELEN|nr:unnamed protein product [Meloidogyne enterolobii]